MGTTIKERPILMRAPMVRALLAGTKTQTRRLVKSQPDDRGLRTTNVPFEDWHGREVKCPYGQPGDRLWVQEHYYGHGCWLPAGITNTGKPKRRFLASSLEPDRYLQNPPTAAKEGESIYDRLLTGVAPNRTGYYKRLGRFMPRAACRLLLEIVAVRVERVQDISEADAKSEGVNLIRTNRFGGEEWENHLDDSAFEYFAKDSYATLWDKINGEGSFLGANPWVWVVEFKVVQGRKEVASA